MQSATDAIHARQHQRHAVSIEARMEPHPDHAEQYRLAVPDAQSGLAISDVSEGGLGLRGGIFVPKRLMVVVHVLTTAGDDGIAGEVLRVRAIVRRCEMVDHKPTYLIGLQFADAKSAEAQRVIEVAGAARQREPVAAGEAADA